MKVLYHGSAHPIRPPQFGFCKPNNDCGVGFYCLDISQFAGEMMAG